MAQGRLLGTVMAAMVVQREEERVSRKASLYFSFLGTLVLPSLYSKTFDIYSSFFDIALCLVWMIGVLPIFFLLPTF